MSLQRQLILATVSQPTGPLFQQEQQNIYDGSIFLNTTVSQLDDIDDG